jgi:hypothetical protein
MEKELYAEGEVAVKIDGEKLVIEYAGKGGGATVFVSADYFLDLLMEAIPGEVDDMVIKMLKAALIK